MEQFGAAREVTYLECDRIAVRIAQAQALRDFLGEGPCNMVTTRLSKAARVGGIRLKPSSGGVSSTDMVTRGRQVAGALAEGGRNRWEGVGGE